jgi:hypothetical protein
MIEVTGIVKPDPGAAVWSGTAKVSGRRALQWFYWPRNWLHVREQDDRNPRCWMNVDPEEGWREQVLRAIRKSERTPPLLPAPPAVAEHPAI